MSDHLKVNNIHSLLLSAFNGTEPPSNFLKELGGWDAIQIVAPRLVNDSLLMPVLYLTARDARNVCESEKEKFRCAVEALVIPVMETEEPALFASAVNYFCDEKSLFEVAGKSLSKKCLTLATPPSNEQDGLNAHIILRKATALEAVAQLAMAGYASKSKLLAMLEDITAPQPHRYAQAVVRTITMAYCRWMPEEELITIINILAGTATPYYEQAQPEEVYRCNEKFQQDIAADAAWALANITLFKALRLKTVSEMCAELDTALNYLSFVSEVDYRDDANLLRAAVSLLRKLLSTLPTKSEPTDAATWAPNFDDVEMIIADVNKLSLNQRGLSHWVGDQKAALFETWSRFAKDLSFLGDHLSRDSIYDAAMVLDHICAIYSSLHSYDLAQWAASSLNVAEILHPAIASGFAARAGLLRHLEDHTNALKRRLEETSRNDTTKTIGLQKRLETAEKILITARESLLNTTGPPGKQIKKASSLPPMLAELVAPFPEILDLLKEVPTDQVERFAADIADRQLVTSAENDLVVNEIREQIIKNLVTAEDFRDEVVPAVTTVLDQLIKFVRQRINAQPSSKPYLFNSAATEQDLHDDLYDWLSQGQFGSSTNVEVQEVGSGRADIQIKFSGFNLYLELKAIHTTTPIAEKTAYIMQTASYQASNVRISFLVVLRKAPANTKAPSIHLTRCVHHKKIQIDGDTSERHIIILEVPGNRTKPSSVR